MNETKYCCPENKKTGFTRFSSESTAVRFRSTLASAFTLTQRHVAFIVIHDQSPTASLLNSEILFYILKILHLLH